MGLARTFLASTTPIDFAGDCKKKKKEVENRSRSRKQTGTETKMLDGTKRVNR
jgi:hypothetical protein